MSVRVESEPRAKTVRPGAIYGNVFHRDAQTLVVIHADRWTLFSDSGTREFGGAGATRLEIEANSAYAIRNDGVSDLHVLALRDVTSETQVLIEPNTRIAGVDGCRRGWIAMVKDGGSIETRLCITDADLVTLFKECAVVAIDVPIGLVEKDHRACDHHARKFLRNKSSVFTAPIRVILNASTPQEAQDIARNVQEGRGLPYTTVALRKPVAQIDRILQRHRELRNRVYEVHPEVSFAHWNGEPLESKRSGEGRAVRRALVSAHFGEIPPPPRGAREADVLDALAALWTAERILAGTAQTLGDARADLTGLPMRIVY